MLLKPGSDFTADRVIELALRQDVGPDPSIAMAKQNYKHIDPNDTLAPTNEYKKKYRDKDPLLAPEAYFAGHSFLSRQ